jgi:hypothetical protein
MANANTFDRNPGERSGEICVFGLLLTEILKPA